MELSLENKNRILLLMSQHWQGRYLRRSTQGLDSIAELFELGAKEQKLRLGEEAYALLQSYRQAGDDSALARKLRQLIKLCNDQSVRLLFAKDKDFPKLLLETADPPELLFVKGSVEALHWPQLAIVGSRKASPSGVKQAEQISKELSIAGIAITSGLALGIDSAAHRGCLAAGGKTIAVLGSGLDQLYPRRNTALSQEIINTGGALLSEYPFGTPPIAANFPKRNRIVTGLALGTLVVEAAERSGSLISASLALDENREVFAIPGSINNPLSRGCHKLLKQGAVLVEGAEDIAQHLSGAIQCQLDFKPATVSPNEESGQSSKPNGLLKFIGYDPLSIDEIQLSSGLKVEEISTQLIELELNGQICQQAGLYQRLK
ncbi:DNA-processing protein DprA [uncultured Pseudoteredinibacter sp.]|uniref:DNA-processing protein DprA n=1 Tax=uncultured Pseudoteredinibacter sp. TaxID=1641701 RepID=UPI0026337A23|nr:DNA-processing protein DprA [uncultured Pseudoteredinibacter sp.]